MTTGSKIVGDSSTPFYFERQWSGNNDVSHRSWNPYSNIVVVRRSSGYVAYCQQLGCAMCSPFPTLQLTADNLTYNTALSAELLQIATSRAQSKLAAGIRGHDFDLGNYAVEGRETVEMALGALSRIRGALKAVRKGDFGKAVKIASAGDRRARRVLDTKDIASAHLGITYGVLPLMGDIMESAKAWSAVVSSQKLHQTASATEKRSGTDIVTHPYYSWNTDFSVRVGYDVVLARPIDIYTSLGLNDPLGIAWEGIPFSFVVDWFLPIGDYLDRLSILPKLEYARLGLTTKVTQVSRLIPGSQKYPWGCSPWGTGYDTSGYTSECTFVRFTRGFGSLASSGIVTPRFKALPKAMSGAHIRNAVALARALI